MKIIKSDATDDFFPGTDDKDKMYFAMEFNICHDEDSIRDTKSMIDASFELIDWLENEIDIVDYDVHKKYGGVVIVIQNEDINIGYLISNLKLFETKGYQCWAFHFRTQDTPYASFISVFSNGISNDMWYKDSADEIEKYVIGRLEIKSSVDKVESATSSRRPIKSEYDEFTLDVGECGQDGTITVTKIDDKWVGSDGKKFMGYLTPEEIVEWYDKDYGSAWLNNSRKPIKSNLMEEADAGRYVVTNPDDGTVLGSADTYEEAVENFGDNVTITDSEAAKDGEDNMELFSSIDELNNKHITEGMRVTWGENSKGKVITWDGNDVLVQGITGTGDDYFIVGYDFELTGNAKEPYLTWMYGDYDVGNDKEQAIQYFENRKNNKINSSKTPTGDKAFLSKIVCSVTKRDMTEEEAIKRIALRNNCNKGFAKNIFNEAMKDESLLTSGIMAIGEDLNKDFDIDGNIESWTEDYVEDSGKSTTVGGEILRAFNRIQYRYYNDGDMIGRGYGKETVNPAARFLVDKCVGLTEIPDDIEDMLNGDSDINKSDDVYNDFIEDLEASIEDYLRNHEELFHTPNKDDMLDYATEDDRDTSVTECYVKDGDGNEYWFDSEGNGDWRCNSIEFGSSPEFEVGDTIDEEQIAIYADVPEGDDYVDFADDGFYYSAEKVDDGEWEITEVQLENPLASESDYWSVDDLINNGACDANGYELSENDLYN